jgi:hypothetical protein
MFLRKLSVSRPMSFKAIPGDDKNVIVEIQCMSCRKTIEIKAPVAGIKARENGALIQNAFPYMSVNDREMFISQICDDCFPKEPDFDGIVEGAEE